MKPGRVWVYFSAGSPAWLSDPVETRFFVAQNGVCIIRRKLKHIIFFVDEETWRPVFCVKIQFCSSEKLTTCNNSSRIYIFIFVFIVVLNLLSVTFPRRWELNCLEWISDYILAGFV